MNLSSKMGLVSPKKYELPISVQMGQSNPTVSTVFTIYSELYFESYSEHFYSGDWNGSSEFIIK
jgi:hypothetical protein